MSLEPNAYTAVNGEVSVQRTSFNQWLLTLRSVAQSGTYFDSLEDVKRFVSSIEPDLEEYVAVSRKLKQLSDKRMAMLDDIGSKVDKERKKFSQKPKASA